MFELLEPRRLLAFDLVVTSITDVYTTSTQTSFGLTLHSANVGSNDFATPYSCQFVVFISKDSLFGNGDDVQVGKVLGPGFLASKGDWGIDEDDTDGGLKIPSSLANGSYHLAARIEVYYGGTENNVSNNSFITDDPVLTFNRSQVWPSPTISGTAGNDVIVLEGNSPRYLTVNGDRREFPAQFLRFVCDAGSGNDKIVVAEDVLLPVSITGSGGNDTVVGGASEDELSGGNGKDKIFGNNSQDYLLGGASNDYLLGGNHDDILSGAGGNDRLIDISGRDYLIGGAGNDVFVTRDLAGSRPIKRDTLSGGEGTDRAQIDDDDITAAIDELLA